MRQQRVAVIGAGAAGLAAARHLLADPARFSCTVFEQTGQVGGTWVYREDVGCDEFGLPIHSSMYKNLRTTVQKEMMEFPDFAFPKQEESFLPAEEVSQFLNDYADHFNLRSSIMFYHHVKTVSPVSGEGWNVVVTNLRSKEEIALKFDAVMVCNGHCSKPFVPHYPGEESFPGEILHSHDYRESSVFRGKRVLLVGMGPTGWDLTVEVAKQASELVHSHHSEYNLAASQPAHVRHAKDVSHIQGAEVHFVDGDSCEVDAILLCTGYEYSFPFLAPECGVSVQGGRVQPLYKHLVNIRHPSMALVGVPFNACCCFRLFDMQVQFFIRTLSGEVRLPSTEEMAADTERDMEERKAHDLDKPHQLFPREVNYFSELASLGGLEPIPPVLCKVFKEMWDVFDGDMVRHRTTRYKFIDNQHFVRIK